MAGPQNTTVTVPDTLTLNCTGMNNEGAPNPLSFRWVQKGTIVDEDERVMILRTMLDSLTVLSQLVISPVSASDGGLYECAVTNREFGPDGANSNSAVVTVQCKFCSVSAATGHSAHHRPLGGQVRA